MSGRLFGLRAAAKPALVLRSVFGHSVGPPNAREMEHHSGDHAQMRRAPRASVSVCGPVRQRERGLLMRRAIAVSDLQRSRCRRPR